MSSWDNTDPWEVSTGFILPPGNHVVTIDRADVTASRGGHPQIELSVSNKDGELRDWLVITQESFGKVIALAQAADIEPTDEEKQSFDSNGLKPPQSFVDRLLGRSVGIVAREEESFKDPTKKITRIQGYVHPSKISSSNSTTNFAGVGSTSKASEPDVPF
jgi:hypothetical protein